MSTSATFRAAGSWLESGERLDAETRSRAGGSQRDDLIDSASIIHRMTAAGPRQSNTIHALLHDLRKLQGVAARARGPGLMERPYGSLGPGTSASDD